MVNRFQQNGDVFQKVHTQNFCNPNISLPEFSGTLIGFIEHMGETVSSGHYTCYVKVASTWFHCNDNDVSIHNDTDMLNSDKAYILFYLK